MSGIFKSVKKAFKKVGKVVKKIAPMLIVAAAVYFGGSYLMSMAGGASAAQSASVATSFTKSAGVWKSFIGGLANGTAASSAAAYAESSYLAMNEGLSLAAQVQAGSSAVQTLGTVNDVQTAVDVGVKAGTAFDEAVKSGVSHTQAQQIAGQTVQEFTATLAPAGDSVAQTTVGTVSGSQGSVGGLIDPGTGSSYPNTGPPSFRAKAPEGSVRDAVTADIKIPSTVPAPAKSAITSIDDLDPTDEHFANKLAALQYRTDQAEGLSKHEQIMAMLDKQHERNMMGLYLQGGGVLLQAYGASQKTAEEKELERRRNWKPTGTEPDIVDPTKFQYPELARARGLLT